jgi:hypothetical protein
MKKILSTALMFIILAATTVDTINAARTEETASRGRSRSRSPRGRRGNRAARIRGNAKNVKAVLEEIKQTNDPVVKAQAIKTANELAKELLTDLQDRTWSGDVLGKYSPEQVSKALGKYTDLEIQRTQLVRDIELKQADLDAMSTKSWVFWSKAGSGKEEDHKIASQELAELKDTLKKVNKAMRNQAVIAGKEYCATIKMAVGALTAAGVAGLAYGIDKYGEFGYTEALKKGVSEQYEELTTKGIRAYAGTKISSLGVVINEKYESMSQWFKDKYNALKNFRGGDKVELKEALDNAKQNEKDIIDANKELVKNPENPDAIEKKETAQTSLQENINIITDKTE